MPRILEDGKLTLEHGASSTIPYGSEVLARIGQIGITPMLSDMRNATQRLLDSGDPDIQIVRNSVDARFRADISGAPEDFQYAHRPDESIISQICGMNDGQMFAFIIWNYKRTELVGQTALKYLPKLAEDAYDRTERLQRHGIFSMDGASNYAKAIEVIIAMQRVHGLDSFDGSYAAAIQHSSGLYFSHLFEGGYEIGPPKPEFFPIGFHEIGHDERELAGIEDRPMQEIEEVMAEHLTVLSTPGDAFIGLDVLGAADYGGYQNLRKAIGYTLRGKMRVGNDQIGEAMTSAPSSTAYTGLIRAIADNMNSLMPQHNGNALIKFLLSIRRCKFGHQQDAVAGNWAHYLKDALSSMPVADFPIR